MAAVAGRQRLAEVKPWGPARAIVGAAAAASIIAPAHIVARQVRPSAPPHLPRLFHKALARSLGIRTHVSGLPSTRPGTLFVCNHLSWADIPVLGSQLLSSFVARADLADWKLFGWMADQQRTIYVERARRTTILDQQRRIVARLAAGDNIILFPEGTSGEGRRTLPFKSALFSVAEKLPDVPVQPATLAYTRLNGMQITTNMLPSITWIGDVQMVPHAASFVRLGRVLAELEFHEPVYGRDFKNRKELARHCHEVVSTAYARLMRG